MATHMRREKAPPFCRGHRSTTALTQNGYIVLCAIFNSNYMQLTMFICIEAKTRRIAGTQGGVWRSLPRRKRCKLLPFAHEQLLRRRKSTLNFHRFVLLLTYFQGRRYGAIREEKKADEGRFPEDQWHIRKAPKPVPDFVERFAIDAVSNSFLSWLLADFFISS